jgi:hypothetical protein
LAIFPNKIAEPISATGDWLSSFVQQNVFFEEV